MGSPERLALLKQLFKRTSDQPVKRVTKESTGLVIEENVEGEEVVLAIDDVVSMLGVPKFEDVSCEENFEMSDNHE